MVLCKPLSIIKRIKYLPVIEKGKHLRLPFIIHQQVEKINIECDRKIFAHVDGELIQSKIFDIKVLPNYFLFKY